MNAAFLLTRFEYLLYSTYIFTCTFFIQSFPHFVSIEVVIFFIQAYLMVFVSGTRLCARIFSQVFLWKIFFGFFNFFFFWDYRIFPTEYTLSSKTLSIYLRLFQWWGIRLIKLIFFFLFAVFHHVFGRSFIARIIVIYESKYIYCTWWCVYIQK